MAKRNLPVFSCFFLLSSLPHFRLIPIPIYIYIHIMMWIMWETWYVCVDCGMNRAIHFVIWVQYGICIRLLFPSLWPAFLCVRFCLFANWRYVISLSVCVVWNAFNLCHAHIFICTFSICVEMWICEHCEHCEEALAFVVLCCVNIRDSSTGDGIL